LTHPDLGVLFFGRDRRRELVRLGVLVCVAWATMMAALGIAVALEDLQDRAIANERRTMHDRTYPSWHAVGPTSVLEDARRSMPEDATYQVVVGRNPPGVYWSVAAGRFLSGFMLPRRQTTSESARWVFCYACDISALGGRFEPVSQKPGLVFGRLER
jgi:hypothetical protein